MTNAALDAPKLEKWIREWFDLNPGGSTNQCAKALNNARLPPAIWIVKRLHLEHQVKKMSSMLQHPAKDSGPGGAQPVSPAHEEEEAMPPPAVTPRPPSPITPTTEVAVLEHRAKEKAAITSAARQLLAQMRLIGCDSCTITIVDDGEKPLTDYKVTFRQQGGGSLEL